MVQDDPQKRPTMAEVVSELNATIAKLNWFKLRTMLVRRRDEWFVTIVKAVYYVSARAIPNALTLRRAIPSPKAQDPAFTK